MISFVLSELHKKFPYHYQIMEDHIRVVFLIGQIPNEKAMEALDFVEELGFKFHSKKDLPVATGGPLNWTQMEYHWKYAQDRLPAGETKFLKLFLGMNAYQRHLLVNKNQ